MPRRIILHGGFHKTGTRALQATLRENRDVIKSHVALRRRWHMRALTGATQTYSITRTCVALDQVQAHFAHLMSGVPPMPERTLIMSASALCGHLPGRSGVMDYGAAPNLLYAFWDIAQHHFPKAEIGIYLTTRAPQPWLSDVYWEQVRTSDMTLDLADFIAQHQRAADLGAVVQDIAARVPCAVHSTALEDCRDLPHGPADPLFDLCDLPLHLRAQIRKPTAPAPRLDPPVLQALLQANRTLKDDTSRHAAKQAILSEALGL